MFIIWRRWGFLVLAFFLLTWALADNVVDPIYRSITGYEFLFNPEKGICWAIAFFAVSLVILAFVLLVLREGTPFPPDVWAEIVEKNAQSIAKYRLKDETDEDVARKQAQVRAQPIPEPAKTSTFFFIPLKWFPYIFAGIGVLLLVINVPVSIAEIRSTVRSAAPRSPRPISPRSPAPGSRHSVTRRAG